MGVPINFFGSINIAATAINAEQVVLDTISQNVSNVNNPSYTDQKVNLSSWLPWPPPGFPIPENFPGQIGGGMVATSVTAFRNTALDTVARQGNTTAGNLNATAQLLQQAQSLVGEPGVASISSLMSTFFNDLQSFSESPNSASLGQVVLNDGGNLATAFHALNNGLQNQIAQANTQVKAGVSTVNTDLQKIASLNTQIVQAQADGQNANDLIDQRNAALSDVSSYINVNVSQAPNGVVNVALGGVFLVQDSQVDPLTTFNDAVGNAQLQFTNFPALTVPLTGGTLQGTINTRDNVIGQPTTAGTLYGNLNTLAYNFVLAVNSRSQLGYTSTGATNIPFFNDDPDNDGDVDGAIGNDADADGANLNWLAGMSVSIANPSQIPTGVASLQSAQNINNLNFTIDPSQTIAAQAADFQVAPVSGTIAINGVNLVVNTGQTIDTIVANINNLNAGVTASFDPSTQQLTLKRDTGTNQQYLGAGIPSPNITVTNVVGNFADVFLIDTAGNPAGYGAPVNTLGAPGDSSNLVEMANVQNAPIAALANSSVTQYYGQTITTLGSNLSNAQNNFISQQAVNQQISNQIQSISGVNSNEQALNLAATQNAISAAERVLATIASIFQTLNNLGNAA